MTPDTLLDRALAHHAAGELVAAHEAAREHATLAPGDARAWHMLGLVRFDLGDLPRAAATLARGLALAPDHATMLHLAARVEMGRGRDPGDLLARAQSARSDDVGIALSRGMARLAAGDSAGALALFERIVAAVPLSPEAQTSLASLRYQLGEGEAFARGYETALALQPRSVALWTALFRTYANTGRAERALDTLARARAATGEAPEYARMEMIARADMGDIEGANALLDQWPADADDPALRVVRIRLALRQRDPARAADLALDGAARPGGEGVWPYLFTAWTLLGDPRADWLLGDPRLVGIYDLAPDLPDLGALADTLRTRHTTRVEPPEQSLRGGTQTDGDLLLREEPPIVALRRAIESAIARHLAQLPPADPAHPVLSRPRGAVRFAGSWSVRLTDRGFHVNHVHPKGWFSSAFYVAVPETADTAGWLKLGQPPADLGLDLPPYTRIEPRPGRLVLFPSILWHGTEPFARGERLSVAFDIVSLG